MTSQTTSSFTCEFNDVAEKTTRKAKLQTVIAGTTFERSLDVDVLPRPTTISDISGPTSVIAGTTATYTYTETHSPFGFTLYGPSCGAHGTVVTSVAGSSITCRFKDVDVAMTTDVGVTVSAGGSTGSSHLAVTVNPDVTPPVFTMPTSVQVTSSSHAGATANFTVSAVDAVSGPSQLIICNASSGQLFPIGTTTVTCSAADWTGNTATASFPVVVIDVTPPSLTLPASQKLNATSPTGAVATFVATAADAIPALPPVSCAPASGSTFAVGATNVVCSASDAAGKCGVRHVHDYGAGCGGADRRPLSIESFSTHRVSLPGSRCQISASSMVRLRGFLVVLLFFPRYGSTMAETSATPASGVLYISRIGKRTRSRTAIGNVAGKLAAATGRRSK